MQISSSYGIEFKLDNRKLLKQTMDLHNDAIAYLMDVVVKEWKYVSTLTGKYRNNYIEFVVHTTKSHTAKYDFDHRFFNMPSYARRAATAKAIGNVSSYYSNYANWVNSGKNGKEPTLQLEHKDMPVFYYDNMYKEKNGVPMLKLFNGKTWYFYPVRFKKTDAKYIQTHWSNVKASASVLEHRYKKWFLRFSFTEKKELNKTDIHRQTICAVDLGLNSDAVCCVMRSDGTVLQRRFINFASDKDQIYTILNRIKGIQQNYGPKDARSLWKYVTRLNNEHAKKVSRAIVSFVIEHGCDVIVFEALNFKGKKVRGSKAQKISLWRKNGIQEYATHDAHRHGIRISRVCAWGSSKLAYDGSGEVERDEKNRALCTFSTGKKYNCDLNASYNIGARYYVREIIKSCSETDKSRYEAEVPDALRRTKTTFNKLLQLNAVIA